ncbi:Ig-like domain-containing protein [Pseudoroseomonas cervicalis]|uniref:Ig-like domain-containing protein n=1 Tax=Teichococcus cervicalis TaxID=204525 RepID=UPI0022F151C8|nr:Ig-like domain-containing protein [Pseudoroseomonas cervicalis]WBV44707.1 Ig-like domain-containing protein [Pseudoroseomonas cervicalis]
MFDAAGAVTAKETEQKQAEAQAKASDLFHDVADAAQAPRSLVAVDPRVANGLALAQQLAPGADVLLLDPGQDGILQVQAALAMGRTVATLHILTHGRDGAVSLGDTLLDATTAAARAGDLAGWRAGLAQGADLLVWSCEAAEGSAGTQLIAALRASTGADIAASTNMTGAGGDFVLERVVGEVDTALLERAASLAWGGTLTVTAAPTIDSLADDSGSSATDHVTNDNTPTLSGTAAAGAEVRLYRASDNALITLVNADASGNWSAQLSVFAVADGTYTVYARANDGSGLSAASAHFTLAVDVVAPIAPVVSGISADTGSSATDGITNQSGVTVSGTAEANSTVQVLKDGLAIGTVTADGSGHWSIGATLSEGGNSFTARATDLAGNIGALSAAYVATLDTVAPAAPSIASISPDTGSSSTDKVTAQGGITVTGTGPANASITLYSSGAQVGSTTSDASGNWVVSLSGTPLAEGSHSLTARATDTAGNQGTDSAAVTVVVDSTAPAAPVLTAISPNTAVLPNMFYTSAQALTLSGTAEANTSVTVLLNGNAIGSTSAAGNGSWSLDISNVQLPAGVAQFTLRGTDTAGNVGTLSAAYAVTVDLTGASPASVSGPAGGTYPAGQALEFSVTFGEAVVATGGTPRLALDIGGTTRYATLQSGSGTSTLVFRYTVQGGDLDADGISATASIDLNGATLTDLAGNGAATNLAGLLPSLAGIRVDGVAPGILGVAVPADGTYGAGQVLRLTVTLDEPVDLSGSASLGLLIGGTARQAAYVSGSGGTALVFDYVVQPGDLDSDGIGVTGLTLAPGATLRDAAGNEASLALHGVGATAGVLVDAVPPAPPSLALDPGSDSGTAGDGRTRDTTPTLSGSAEPNSSVTILVDGVADGVALADGAGLWSHTLLTPLTDGPHSLTATATDAQNNVSAPSAPLLLTIDTAAPGRCCWRSTPAPTAAPPAMGAAATPPRPSPAAPSPTAASPCSAMV